MPPEISVVAAADGANDAEIAIANIVANDVNRLLVCKGNAVGSQGVSGLLFRGHSATKLVLLETALSESDGHVAR